MSPPDAEPSPHAAAPTAPGLALDGADAALAAMLFETSAAGVALVDRDLRYVRVNATLARMNGRSAAEHTGRAVRDILPRAAAESLEPLLRDVMESGRPVLDLAFTAELPGEGVRRFLASYVPVRDPHGRVAGVAGLVAERTAAEVALRESEGRLRNVAESGIVGLFFWSMDGGITEANDAFLAMLGYTQRDLAEGRVDWRRMTPPEYAASDEIAVRELLATGRHGQLAKEYIGRDGRRVPVVVTSALIDGAQDRGVCVCLDDTARRAAEARLGRVLMQTPAAVAVLLGPDHVVQSVNELFLRLLGRRDYVGRPAREGAPELVEQGFITKMDEVYRTGVPFVGREAPLVWDREGDGALREGYFDFVYQPLVDDAGAVEGILVFAVEVTAQVLARRATEEAARRTALLQALTAALAGTHTMEDVASVVVAQAVTAMGARSGMLAAPVAGTDQAVIVRQAGFTADVAPQYARFPVAGSNPAAICLRTGEAIWITGLGDDTLMARLPAMEPVWRSFEVAALATVPLVVGAEVIGAISFTWREPRPLPRDDREFFLALGGQAAQALDRARANAAERAARADAEAANRAKSDFLAVMSHELRTPLNAIGGYAELLEMGIRGPVTPLQLEDLRRIQVSQRHLLGLINEVLNYAKLETGTVRFDMAEVRLQRALSDAEGLVAPQAAAKGLALEVCQPAPTLAVRADTEKLRQILVNLLSNAVKFTDRGGRIAVTCDADAARVHIAVRDTGIGIPADKLGVIFEPFVQVRADFTRTADGTGLGLAISRDLAHGMGGELAVESALGEGSTFTLTLQRA